MTNPKARALAHITFTGFYGWIGYLTTSQESMPGFWRGIVHGIFWLARLIFEMWMDFSIFVNPHFNGYTFAFILGVFLAFFVHYLYINVFIILLQLITGKQYN